MSITTGQGDTGDTRLFSGERVRKSAARPEAYGALDELVSHLGVARSLCGPDHAHLAAELRRLQDELFVAGAELASTAQAVARLPRRVDAALAAALESRRAALERALPPATGFILPGGTPLGAQLDVARAVARRVERRVVALHDDGEVANPHLLVWLNRLSDHLWLLARAAEGAAGEVRPSTLSPGNSP
jgi:cob(I)alamin adenosyltransferase